MAKWLLGMIRSASMAVRRSRRAKPQSKPIPGPTKAQYQRNHRASRRRRLEEIRRRMPDVVDQVTDAASRAREERRLRGQLREDRRRGIL